MPGPAIGVLLWKEGYLRTLVGGAMVGEGVEVSRTLEAGYQGLTVPGYSLPPSLPSFPFC